ncbi:hypothetical protein [Colwellia chukchiensis]|nr:hypothetical protein [Colwellia chukchiensis]
MQINNASNIASRVNTQGNKISIPAQEQRLQNSAREALAAEQNQDKKAQAASDNRQRLDIDEQAINAITRQEQGTFTTTNAQQQNKNQNSYDSPSTQNQSAVAAYQSVDTIAQRDNIEQIFGVDLFA